MNKIEKTFDINMLLLTVFSSLETLRNEKNIELIYDIDPTIPRELRGDSQRLQRVLTQVLTFVLEHTDKKEILLALSAPEDFLYKEDISFKIKETNIVKIKVQEFLETRLSKILKILDGKIVDDKSIDMHIDIPFQINELGYRRHYRLPDISMMGKKILVLCESEKVTESIKKMFKYFLYEVDAGVEEFTSQGSNMAAYDILLLEDKYATGEFDQIISKVQQELPLKYVLLRDSHITAGKDSHLASTHLIKPVTQESVFELIISLFQHDVKHREIKTEGKKYIVDLEKVFKNIEKLERTNPLAHLRSDGSNINGMIEKKKGVKELTLDKVRGEENTRKMGLTYTKELKSFVETFDRSDRYFRQMVNEKATEKIKDFCIDLEKHSNLIGAQSMMRFADIVSLIFIYNKLDMLPIYPGRYHLELEKLLEEINTYLDS